MKYVIALIPLMMLPLTGCETSGRGTSQSFCTAGHPIYLSKDDKLTKATERAILAHDEIGAKLCGWKGAN